MANTLDLLKDLAQQHGQATALQENDIQVSYEELATAVHALAVALQMRDPTPGSRVALCALNSLEYLVSVLAIETAGKALLPLDPHAKTETLHALLQTGLPGVVILDETGERVLPMDDDYKITFSQFPGLVHTYRDHPLPVETIA